jgi:hypothetical protein
MSAKGPDHATHPDRHHDPHASAAGEIHGTFSGYMTGFILSVILTAIPFWLVMGDVFASKQLTAMLVMGIGADQMWCIFDLFSAYEPEFGGRLDADGADIYAYHCWHRSGRLALGHAPSQRKYDARYP